MKKVSLDRIFWWAVTAGLLLGSLALGTCAVSVALGQSHRHGTIVWTSRGTEQSADIGEDDLLVLARMVIGSQTAGAIQAGNTGHSDAAACRLWTATNRFVLQRDNGIRWRSVAQAAQAYSTAIAPQWSAGGNCALPEWASRPLCEPRRLRRRARISSLTWERIATWYADLRGYLQSWARGDVPAPAGCDRTVHTDGLWRHVTVAGRVQYGSNFFWPNRQSAGWPDRYVRLQP